MVVLPDMPSIILELSWDKALGPRESAMPFLRWVDSPRWAMLSSNSVNTQKLTLKRDHPIQYHHQQNLLGILPIPSILVVISEVENKKNTKNLEETEKSPNFADDDEYLI